jgi:hypothetical protein
MSQIGSTVCDSVVVDDEGNPRVREEVIKKGQMFETLDAMQLFFQQLPQDGERMKKERK